jgi:hypothetical protein
MGWAGLRDPTPPIFALDLEAHFVDTGVLPREVLWRGRAAD